MSDPGSAPRPNTSSFIQQGWVDSSCFFGAFVCRAPIWVALDRGMGIQTHYGVRCTDRGTGYTGMCMYANVHPLAPYLYFFHASLWTSPCLSISNTPVASCVSTRLLAYASLDHGQPEDRRNASFLVQPFLPSRIVAGSTTKSPEALARSDFSESRRAPHGKLHVLAVLFTREAFLFSPCLPFLLLLLLPRVSTMCQAYARRDEVQKALTAAAEEKLRAQQASESLRREHADLLRQQAEVSKLQQEIQEHQREIRNKSVLDRWRLCSCPDMFSLDALLLWSCLLCTSISGSHRGTHVM